MDSLLGEFWQRLKSLPHGVRLAGPSSAAQSKGPGQARGSEQRFMDVISVPQPTEELSVRQIREVNRLRRTLLDDTASPELLTNQRIKRAIASAAGNVGVKTVLDWGCGYHCLRPFIDPGVEFVGVDIDPDVVAHNRAAGIDCRHPSEFAKGQPDQAFDAILSVFVFHFKLPANHIDTMVRLIGQDGFILANVYRRSAESRQKLRGAFLDRGVEVRTTPDPTESAAGNEFWFIAAAPGARELGDQVLAAAAASMLQTST